MATAVNEEVPTRAGREIPGNPRRDDTIKAIGQEACGSPDVLKLQNVDKPVVQDDRLLIQVRGSR